MMNYTMTCQCPQRASTYFFGQVTIHYVDLANVCQCPQRASTYFFYRDNAGNHYEYRVSMPSTGFYLFLQ